MADKQVLLDQLQAKMVQDNPVPELAAGAQRVVFGEGNPDADVIFIGEAPGKNEDLTGRPFVGAAGKFLDEMLATANLKRQDVYITSILKHRPPNNRDPKPAEKTAFLPYLKSQIDIIKPKLIVLLGRHSMDSLLPGLTISQVHGVPQISGGYTYLPLYHPAAALYNGSMRQTLLDDFAKIPSIIAE
jgi:uracil-DNA glycosylase family 4